MQLALSQVCSLPSPLERDIKDYAAGRCGAIDLWLTKIEQHLQSHSIDDLRELLEAQQMTPVAASYQGGLLSSQGEARREAWELFAKRLDLCQQLGVGALVLACDVSESVTETLIRRVQTSLQQATDEAASHDVRLALEPQANASLGNNLQTVAALVADVARPELGICLDAFHYYVGPSKPEDLGLLTNDNLFLVQLCDLSDRPRELARDSDRILPGDGDIVLGPIVEHLLAIKYEGPVSVEVMNPQIWQVPALQFGEIAMTALRKLLGQADMGEGA